MSAAGTTMLSLQDEVRKLEIADPAEEEQFLAYVRSQMGEDLRHKLLTWRHNRATPQDVQRAGEVDKAARG